MSSRLGFWKLLRRNQAAWFCKRLDGEGLIKPAADTDLQIRDDFPMAAEWIRKRSLDFPWIFNRRELDFAEKYRHPYPLLIYRGNIAGFVKIALERVYIEDYEADYALDKDEAFIYDTFILPEFRGRHLGRILLENALPELYECGCKFVFCHIPDWNAASLRLYQGLGFRRLAEVRYVRLLGLRYFSRPPVEVKKSGRMGDNVC